jgi:hypothetical protein
MKWHKHRLFVVLCRRAATDIIESRSATIEQRVMATVAPRGITGVHADHRTADKVGGYCNSECDHSDLAAIAKMHETSGQLCCIDSRHGTTPPSRA